MSKSAKADNRFRLLLVMNVALAMALAALYFHRSHRVDASVPVPVVAVVNDEPITGEEFDRTIKVVSGAEVLRRLAQEKVIFHEAKRYKITLDDPDSLLALNDLNKRSREPESYRVYEQELRSQLLLRKLLLQDVSEERKRQIYDHFKDALVQYEIFAIVAPPDQLARVRQRLAGGETFDKLAAAYSLDRRSRLTGGRIGFFTLPKLQAVLGPAAAVMVRHLKSQAVSPQLLTPFGTVLLKVGKIKSSYEDLHNSVEGVVVEAGRAALLYRLTTDAIVDSKYLVKSSASPVSAGTSNNPSADSVFGQPSTPVSPSDDAIFSVPSARPSGSSVFAAPRRRKGTTFSGTGALAVPAESKNSPSP